MLSIKLGSASGICQIFKQGSSHKSSAQVAHFNKSITTATRGINKSSTWIIRGRYEGRNDGCALHKLSPLLFQRKQAAAEIVVTPRQMSCEFVFFVFFFFKLNDIEMIAAEMWGKPNTFTRHQRVVYV